MIYRPGQKKKVCVQEQRLVVNTKYLCMTFPVLQPLCGGSTTAFYIFFTFMKKYKLISFTMAGTKATFK